jgi:uncharacterized protein (DUF362 family)
MKRRDFLKKATVTGTGGLILSTGHGAGELFASSTSNNRESDAPPGMPAEKSKVYLCREGKLPPENDARRGKAVEGMVDTILEGYFECDPAEAIKAVIGKNRTVGIKVNCLSGRRMSSSVILVKSIVSTLLRAGVPANHILIWDRSTRELRNAGFTPHTGGNDVQCYGTDKTGYESELREWGTVGSLVSRILTNRCDYIINVPVLKDHGIVGVTLGMKNFFGAIHNPNKYHPDRGNPFVADLNMFPLIRKKLFLTVLDGLTAQYEGGPPFKPQWSWPFGGILLSGDPVALDFTGWRIIEEKRAEKGHPTLKEAGREPSYILTAADETHRLGRASSEDIELISL